MNAYFILFFVYFSILFYFFLVFQHWMLTWEGTAFYKKSSVGGNVRISSGGKGSRKLTGYGPSVGNLWMGYPWAGKLEPFSRSWLLWPCIYQGRWLQEWLTNLIYNSYIKGDLYDFFNVKCYRHVRSRKQMPKIDFKFSRYPKYYAFLFHGRFSYIYHVLPSMCLGTVL